MRNYWQRQEPDKPLFPDLLWSRPENRMQAGKLLIVGGNVHGFAAAGDAYAAATASGIGTARVLLPDSLQAAVGKVFEAGEFAPSTPSGSFGRRALAESLAMSEWSDGVMLAGDFGRNSETAVMLEHLVAKYERQLTITKDAVDYFIKSPGGLLEREKTLLVISFGQLQKLASASGSTTAFTFDMDLLRLVDALHEFTLGHQVSIIVKHLDTIFVAVSGQIVSNKLSEEMEVWRVVTAAEAAVWWLQNPSKPLEALTTSLVADRTAA